MYSQFMMHGQKNIMYLQWPYIAGYVCMCIYV